MLNFSLFQQGNRGPERSPGRLRTSPGWSQFSLAVCSLGGQQVLLSHAWGPMRYFPSLSDLCLLPLTLPSQSQSPPSATPPLLVRLPRFPEMPGDRVWLPECPELGTGLERNQDLCLLCPIPGCPFMAPWVNSDSIWELPNGQRSQKFLQKPIKKAFLDRKKLRMHAADLWLLSSQDTSH